MVKSGNRIAVVIPCYKVRNHIQGVIESIPPEVSVIYCVDDCCPDNSGDFIRENISDDRVEIIQHSENQGVGGAVMSGYRKARNDGCHIAVKIDGDGQMDPAMIDRFVAPILRGDADYTKGNRFYTFDDVSGMPFIRMLGNALLSFLAKLSTGYWSVFDPTNGYTAIHLSIVDKLGLEKVAKRYFFESDLLFRLNIARCVVVDVPMGSRYADEESNLRIHRILFPFLWGHTRNFLKRIIYSYYVRDFSLASLEFVIGMALTVSGTIFGVMKWLEAVEAGVPATAGTVMVAALQLVVGLQLILSAISYDMNAVPKQPLHRLLGRGDGDDFTDMD